MPDIKDELIADLRGQIRSCRCPCPVLPDESIGACVDGGKCGCLHKEAASDGPAADISIVAGNAASRYFCRFPPCPRSHQGVH